MSHAMSKRVAEARNRLQLATKQFDDACTASWEPPDPAECVSKCFYAFENAVVAAATALSKKWEKDHRKKAILADTLFREGKLITNIRDLLFDLNDVRKDISYDEPGSTLAEFDLDDLVSDLEDYLGQVESLIDDVEGSD